jgi:hypothetical protein
MADPWEEAWSCRMRVNLEVLVGDVMIFISLKDYRDSRIENRLERHENRDQLGIFIAKGNGITE